jgi:CRISPR-associated protein Cas1
MCHAAIVAGGYSPGHGFIHTGRQLSFVYGVGRSVQVDVTIRWPSGGERRDMDIEARVRRACRDRFGDEVTRTHSADIDRALEIEGEPDLEKTKSMAAWAAR